jgi:hypothetical protein
MEDNTFLANLKQEGGDPFAELENKETDTPADSPAETKPEEAKPNEGESTKEPVVNTQEEEEPFHRRWKVREEKLKTELEEKFQRDLELTKQELEQRYAPKGKQPAPQFLTDMVGDNEQVAKSFNQYERDLIEKAKFEFSQEQERKIQAQQQEEQKWNNWIDDQVESLKEEGHQFDRNELLKTVLDYRPTDQNNNYDFKAALKILQLQKPKESNKSVAAKKAIADTTTSGSQGESSPRDYVTAKDIRNIGWSSL